MMKLFKKLQRFEVWFRMSPSWAAMVLTVIAILCIAGSIFFIETDSVSDVPGQFAAFKQSIIATLPLGVSPSKPMTPTAKPTLGPGRHYVWRLQKKDGTIVGRLFTFPPSKPEVSLDIVRIKDTLFYTDETRQTLLSMDIYTGIVKHVFDMPTEFREQREQRNPGIFGMYTRDDILFVTANVHTAGFANEGKTYAIRMSDLNTVIDVADFPGHVEYINNKPYLTRNDSGDVCGGRTTYATIDMNMLHATRITDTSAGCSKGDAYIAIDKEDRMVLANSDGDTGPGGPFIHGLPHYKYIYAIPVGKPIVKKGIIAAQDMPEDVTDITYYPQEHMLIMVGKALYRVHLTNNTNEKIADLPAGWTNMWIEKREADHICITHPLHNIKDYGGDEQIAEGLEVNLQTHETKANTSFCPDNPAYSFHGNEQPTSTSRTLAEKLGMPDYEFVLTKEYNEK